VPDLTIEVTRPELTRAYDMRGGAEYVFAVRITNRSYARLEMHRFSARVSWHARLLWPGDPRIYVPENHVYRLESGRTFPCAEVLNHRVRARGGLEPGESCEGLLLAYNMFHPICRYIMHGSLEPVKLSIVDQYSRRHLSYIEITVDRTATMRPITPRRGKGLFEKIEPDTNVSRRLRLPTPAETVVDDDALAR
jgi:hypothetical protein